MVVRADAEIVCGGAWKVCNLRMRLAALVAGSCVLQYKTRVTELVPLLLGAANISKPLQA